MRQELQPYRPNNIIQYHKIIFDLRTTEKISKHTQAMTSLMDCIKHIEYECVEILVYTHSETFQGDLWGRFEESEIIGRGKSKKTMPGKPMVYTVDQFFAGLFVSGIEDYVKGSTLWMLACSHMVWEPDTFKLFKDCIKHYEVEHTFAFGAELFHACLTTPLITSYVEHVLIEGFEVQEVMQDLLLACPWLANHSSIIHLHVANSAFHHRRPTMAEYKQGVICIPGEQPPIRQSFALPMFQLYCITSHPSVLNKSKFTCKNLKCGHTITYTMPKQPHIILFSKGHCGTSTMSGQHIIIVLTMINFKYPPNSINS
ncbi:uncharacterized protein BJ212DRAFT_1294762 [Suillus subaureus]|uniref:Uncharacterized protein n=1 Tax=Suillus subaureus TaxID=48587 RepID=A0A9P7EPC5_9AGAM|nr:uncharacterized protein BJ212DRAFT_1294762 [Suillus subaureus]KAG1827511.1 hypothetical protein BJ212DRAFT_1294762 [Suillus subaureus]